MRTTSSTPRPPRRAARRSVCAGALVVCAVLGAASTSSPRSRAAAPAVSVFPISGGHVAAPATQITFRGVAAAQLGPITVTGSRSGVHSGQVVADSDGDGASFIPAERFTPGETVTVTTGLEIAGGAGGTYRFTIAEPGGPIRIAPRIHAPRARGDVDRFASAAGLTPPAVTVDHLPRGAESGDLFVADQAGPLQYGPMILGPEGGLIWFKPLPAEQSATDFRVQTYEGAGDLTWWQGTVNGGIGTGEDEIYDSSYRPVATVRAGNGLRADLHEFQLTPQGTALVTAYYPVYVNASSVRHGRRHQLVLDAVAQEIDVRTGLVLFQWDSLDHVPLADSYQPVPAQAGHPWDYFHINSIQQAPDGDIVISGRNTWAVYDVSPQTGAIVWTLGGRHPSFKMGSGTTFAFQHDARLQSNGEITLFDDGAGPPIVHSQSRALTLRLDTTHMTATLVQQDEHRPKLLAEYEGSVQLQPNGDRLVGWGEQPFITEFNARGQVVFDAHFVGLNSTYRAYRFAWSATPANPVGVAAGTTRGRTVVEASWNGATDVARWRVLGGSAPTSLVALASTPRQAFETVIRLPRAEAYVATQALDAQGRVLGTSKAIKVGASAGAASASRVRTR